jgi:hypothetical protein
MSSGKYSFCKKMLFSIWFIVQINLRRKSKIIFKKYVFPAEKNIGLLLCLMYRKIESKQEIKFQGETMEYKIQICLFG